MLKSPNHPHPKIVLIVDITSFCLLIEFIFLHNSDCFLVAFKSIKIESPLSVKAKSKGSCIPYFHKAWVTV